MHKIVVVLALGLILLSLTGCVFDNGKHAYSTDEEVKEYLESEYGQKVTYINVARTEGGVRYWEFGLENYPDKVFETKQRKNTDTIIALGDAELLGVAEEIFDEPGTNNNVGNVLLPDYYNAFLTNLSEEEKQLETAVANYTIYIRVNEKEQVDTAIGIAQKFEKYLDEQADLDYSITCKLKKDFGDPQGNLIESTIREQNDCVTISFELAAADKCREEFLKRWDEFENK